MAKPFDYKVSVIIPVFNTARYLAEAVGSVVHLPETGEVILIDDASTDHSLELCLDIQRRYSKVRVLQHPDRKNHGVAASRNRGIEAAVFEFVSFLDADDCYLPNRFTKEKEIFASFPEVDGVYGCNQAVFESETARERFISRYKSEQTTVGEPLPPQELFRALLFGGKGQFHTSAITLRKTALQKTGLFNTSLRMAEDTELWLKLSLQASLVAGSVHEPVSIRRVHSSNSIHKLENAQYYGRQMYQALFDWVVQESFSFDVKNCLFVSLHKFGKGAGYDVKRLFWLQVTRNPKIVLTSFFFKKIHQLYFT